MDRLLKTGKAEALAKGARVNRQLSEEYGTPGWGVWVPARKVWGVWSIVARDGFLTYPFLLTLVIIAKA